MKIYTSYYDKVPELNKDDYTFVRVSRADPPEWFSGTHACIDLSERFGPSQAMLQECHPLEKWEVFEPRYKKEILGLLNKGTAIEAFKKIYSAFGSKPLVLLCYETAEQNCHRHLIIEFLELERDEI